MNTLVLSVAYLAVAQVSPSQFDPGQVISPVQPAPMYCRTRGTQNAVEHFA